MKRRLLSAFLAVMMVLTMAPVAFAADEDANTVDDSTSAGTGSSEAAPAETLQDKIKVAALSDGKVTLDKDYTEDITIRQGQNITLNLNGKKLTNKTGHTITVEQGATLTINGVGTVDNVTHAKSALVNYGEVVLDNGVTLERSSEKGTLDPYNNGGNSYYTILNDKGATMTINNATVENSGGYSSAIRNGGDSQCDKESHLTINDGNFSGGLNAVKNDEFGILTINGGTFSNSSQYVVMNWHNAIINAGTFSAKESSDAVLQTASYDPVRGVGKLEITGGIFNCTGAQDMIYPDFIDGNGKHYPGTASITGGTFSSDVSAYVAEGYVQNNGTVEQLGATNAVAKVGDTYYKTLSAAVAVAKDGDTVTLLKNVVLNSTLTLNKNLTLDLNGCVISNGSELGTNYLVNIASGAKVSIVGDKANSKIADSRNNAKGTITAIIVYGNLTVSGDNLTISRGANGIAIKVEDNPGTLTVNSGTITVDAATVTSSQAIQNWGNATINGGVFNGDVDSYAYIAANKNYVGNMTIKNGIFNGEVFAAQLQYDNQWPTASARVAITGGNFKGIIAEYYHDSTKGLQPVENVSKPANTAESEVVVSGGDFSSDPSGYLAVSAEGQKYVAGAINESPYFFRVALVKDNQIPVVPAVGETAAPSAKELEKTGMTKEAAEAVAAAAQEVAAGDTEIKEAVAPIATGITDEKAAKYQQAAVNDVDNVEKIEVRAYLEVKPTAYNADKAYTLDITPKYDVVVVGTKDGATAEKVVETNTLNVTKATRVSVQLPTGFVSDTNTKLYVQHKGHEYDAAVTANNGVYTANFTNPHGFSPFTISKTPQTVATIGTDKYTSFADAVSAVPANGTIEITGGTSPYTGTANKTFTVKNSTSADITVNGQTIKPTKSYTFKYTHSSGSSSGGSSSGKTTYKVTTSAVNNGGVNASPSSAEKGATITITLSPDKGYKLDKLTVTDGSGKTVSTVKKSDTVYTFTMPASAVKVGVSYVKATETPSETKFNDVSANDWFASAVDYVTGKGMMNGTADNTFSPKANTTRGMVVTVLYRLENQPSTSAASFTDVASGAYYANAVAWANANGIVSGYGSGKFGPNDKVTREQLAAILYRYAQYKKYDVSVGEDTNILSYDDAQSISSYAIPAIQWACGAGVVTGKSGSKLDPKGNATRAEVAAMLMRFCENVK